MIVADLRLNTTKTGGSTQASRDSQLCATKGICVTVIVIANSIAVHPRGNLGCQQGEGGDPEDNGEDV